MEEGEPPKERIERLLREGKITEEAVKAAEALWQSRLQYGVTIPNGETAVITLDDIYHVIVDNRIWRKPYRIEAALRGVFEIHTAEYGRRQCFSRWEEVDATQVGLVILEANSRLKSLHLVDERRLRKQMRHGGLLWKR